MPGDLLLPLFVITLLANAFLVAAAIRSLRHDPSRSGRTGFGPTRPRPSTAALTSGASADQMPADRRPIESPSGPPDAASIRPDAPSNRPAAPPIPPSVTARPATAASRRRAPSPEAAVPPNPPKPVKRRRAAATAPIEPRGPQQLSAEPPSPEASSALGPADPAPAEPRKRGRRRFSLPPLDADHEKVSRSIETFLTGVDGTGPDAASDPDADPANPAAAELIDVAGPEASVQTVAMVAVVGLPEAPPTDSAKRRRTAARRSSDSGEAALAMVERTLRGAARGSDVVKVWAHGIFRIDLPATGAFAARVYLRRVRATLEPMLEAADPSLRLIVATATVLDEPLEVAIRQVERRLRAALDAEHVANDIPGSESPDRRDEPDRAARGPRAAGD